MNGQDGNDLLREQALGRLKKKREFSKHLVVYIAVNSMLVVIWAVPGGGFFWPVFPIIGWGIGIIAHAWDVYRGEPTEAEIRKEMDRLAKRRT